ncbi:MAG: hypothetical protein NC388_09555 [Clostridium sp.]|nr:hypothetical protein [Clostridium sp.]
MKPFKAKSLTSLIAAVACTLMLTSCQVVDLIVSGTTYYDTEIITNDNQLVNGRIGGQRSSNLSCGTKTISIKTEEGRKKIKSEEIAYMKLARKNHPEKQQTLIFTEFKFPYTRKGVQKYKTYNSWQVVKSVGDNLIVTAYGNSYKLAKNGSLVVTYASDEGIKYCIRRRQDDGLLFLGRSISSRSFMRKQWLKYLADDEVLCEKIEKKEIDAFDFTAITEQYTPGRKCSAC